MKRNIVALSAGIMAFLGLMTAGCSDADDVNPAGGGTAGWLIPSDQVFDGGPGKDGIPSIDNPQFTTLAKATFLTDEALIVGMRVGDEIRAYPHPILDWHEIVNDKIQSTSFALTYCPLTGSALGWNRVIDGRETTFGVSGLLYNTNLIPYDRASNSNWSQMRNQCVNGQLIGRSAEIFQVVETTWKSWKQLFPQSTVMSINTGFSRPYGSYPYFNGAGQDYRIDPFLIFPTELDDTRLPRKDRGVGLSVAGKGKAYRINAFALTIETINDTFNGLPIVVVGSSGMNFGAAYGRQLGDGALLSLQPLQNELPAVMVDNEGTKWDLFGYGVSGARAGQRLPATDSYIAYWFAWATFNPGSLIHDL